MEYIAIVILFAPIIYLAARQKKWYLYMLFGFMGILPEQFSFEIHEKLPLITATRLLIVLVCAFWAYKKWQTKRFSWPVSILAFLAVNIIVSLINIRSGFDEVNRIFLYGFERVLVILMAFDLVEDREEFNKAVDFVILGAVALSVIGICQTVFEIDIASPLHIVKTVTSIMLSDRMDLTRAFATTNAISYGCYSAFVSILIYYRLSQTKMHRYSVALGFNTVALICTFSRSAWFAFVGIFGLIFLTRPKKFIKEIWASVLVVLILCVGLSSVEIKFGKALVETAKSSVNTVVNFLPDSLFEQTTDPNVSSNIGSSSSDTSSDIESSSSDISTQPESSDISSNPQKPVKPQKPSFELSEDFGLNGETAGESRLLQWSAVKYMAKEGTLLFGYGYNGFLEGKAHYYHYAYWGDNWSVAKTLDVGFVALIIESGLVGLLAYIGLLGYILIVSIRKRKSSDGFNFYKLSIFVVIAFVAINIMAVLMFDQIVWLYFALFYAYDKLHREGKMQLQEQPFEKWSF